MYIAYVAITIVVALANSYAAALNFAGTESVKVVADEVRVSQKWMIPFGVLLACGAAGLLAGLAVPVLGTAAAIGLVGYFIGAELYDSLGQWLIHVYGLGGKVDAFREAYARYGALIILIKGVTPIPYKLVTIVSGFARFNLLLFVICSIVARGMRFYLTAFLLNRYGAWVREVIEKRLGLWVAIGAGVLVIGFIVVFRLF